MSPAGRGRVAEAPAHPVALVTGGAVRVGRAIALGVAEAGYDVAISCWSSSEGAAEEVRARVASLGRRSLVVRADLAQPEVPARVVDAVAAEFGALDLLVNSAASFRSASLLDVTCEEWDAVMALNLRAPFLLVRRAAPLLRRTRGAVVNIVDLSALQAWSGYPHHSVSKAGLLHLTKVMARSLAPEVRVNAIAPGHVLAPSDGPACDGTERPKGLVDRPGRPEDVVQAVLYLASAEFLTGEVVVCDGGQLLRT